MGFLQQDKPPLCDNFSRFFHKHIRKVSGCAVERTLLHPVRQRVWLSFLKLAKIYTNLTCHPRGLAPSRVSCIKATVIGQHNHQLSRELSRACRWPRLPIRLREPMMLTPRASPRCCGRVRGVYDARKHSIRPRAVPGRASGCRRGPPRRQPIHHMLRLDSRRFRCSASAATDAAAVGSEAE